ncbi:hypothetical protein C8J56DRAFT_724119, partial [Mycena floridula]
LAAAFHEMLVRYNLEHKILSFTADNATSNDTQTMYLSDNVDNIFDSVNRIRCFNHTLNLAV